MKLLHFIESGGPGGAERVFVELSKILRDAGIDVSTASFREGWMTEELARLNFNHTVVPTRRGVDPLLPWRIASIARTLRADLIQSHLLDSNFYCAIAAKIAGIPQIGIEHGDVHHLKRKKFLVGKLKTISLFGGKLISVSKFSADRIFELAGVRSQVIGNPLAPLEFPRSVRELVRSELGLKHFTWFHVANLRPVKDQRTLLRGFFLAAQALPMELVIIGEGPERVALEEIIIEQRQTGAALAPGSRVQLLGHRDDVRKLLCGADGFVLTSHSEALPVSLLEAASLPIVASQVGGIPELLGTTALNSNTDSQLESRSREIFIGSRGITFPAGDIEGLAKALANVVSDQTAASHRAQLFERFVQEHYSTQAVLRGYLDFYRSLGIKVER